jgi:hypothetical protein
MPPSVEAGAEYGTSVDISAEHVIVGAPRQTATNLGAGAAYVFGRITGSL